MMTGKLSAEAIGELCDCDVAASNDVTGHAALGGDWDLEYQIGAIESSVVLSAPSQPGWYSTLDITSNLLLHNTFETDATDSSGNSYDGTLANGASIDTSATTNQIGDGKVRLDGADDFVDLSTHVGAFQNLTEGTIAAWVYADTGLPYQTIFEVSDEGDADSRVVIARTDTGNFNFFIRENSSTLVDVETAIDSIPLNTWTHVAVTVDATGHKIYVNGAEVTSGLTYNTGSANSNEFFDDVTNLDFVAWGRDKYDGSSFREEFDGLIDDGRVYDRALTASDISELYDLGPEPSPIAYEPFDYPAGSLEGRNGGTGFAAGWVTEAPSSAIVNTTGLTGPTGTLPVQGGTARDEHHVSVHPSPGSRHDVGH